MLASLANKSDSAVLNFKNMKINCRKFIQFYENELQPAFFQTSTSTGLFQTSTSTAFFHEF